MLYDILDRLYLIDVYRVLLEIEEVTYEYRSLFLIYNLRVLLELLIAACSRCKLQGGYRFWVPCMLYTILAPVELSLVRQEVGARCITECHVVETYCILCNCLQSYTSYC